MKRYPSCTLLPGDTFILLSNLQRVIEFVLTWVQMLGEDWIVGYNCLTRRIASWAGSSIRQVLLMFPSVLPWLLLGSWVTLGHWWGHCPCVGLCLFFTFLLLWLLWWQLFLTSTLGSPPVVESMFYFSLLCRLLAFLSIGWILHRIKITENLTPMAGLYLQL